MTVDAEDIVIGFFSDRYGLLMSRTLFAQYLEKLHITDFSDLKEEEKVDFGQKVIEHVYKKFYPPDKIQNLKLLFLIRFAMNSSIQKINDLLETDADMRVEPFETVFDDELADAKKLFDNPKSFNVGFTSKEVLDGALMVSMDLINSIDLGKRLIFSMTHKEDQKNEMDEIKITAIYEFFNMIIPDFLKVISDIYGQNINFLPLRYDEFLKSNCKDGRIMPPSKSFKTTLELMLGKHIVKLNVYFFLNDANKSFIELLSKQGEKAEDPFEYTPPKIFLEKTGDVRADIEKFFGLLSLRPEDLDIVMERAGFRTLDNFRFHEFAIFYKFLAEEYFPNSSEQKKRTIKENLKYLLGIAATFEK